MSISQLDDPSMREALGLDSTLNAPVTMGSVTLRDGGAGVLEIFGATAGLEIVDPNPLVAPTALTVGNLTNVQSITSGTGNSSIGLGFNSVSAITNRSGVPLSGGFQISTTTTTNPVATGSLYFNPNGEFCIDRTAPASAVSTQVVYKPCYVQAICSVASTPVGGSGSVIVPLSSLPQVSSTGNPSVADWSITGGNTLLSGAGVEAGLYEFNAAVQLVTTGVSAVAVDVYFNQTGVFALPNSRSRFTLQPNEPQSVFIHDYLSLIGANQSVEVVVASTDPLVAITTIAPSGAVPQALGCELWVSRIA